MPLRLGQMDGKPFDFPETALRKHAVVLGASGSGKTVLCKALVEEATLAGIPSILIDPQGDLASLALPGDETKVKEKGGERGDEDVARMKEFFEKAEVRIFTPASSRGVPMSCDPLQVSREGLDQEEVIHTLDLIATSLALLLGYDLEVEKGKACKALLYKVLERGHDEDDWPKDIEKFAERVEAIWKSIEAHEEWLAEAEAAAKAKEKAPPKVESHPLAEDAKALIDMSTMKSVSRNLRFLAVGVNKLIFSFGVGISLEQFLEPVTPGKVPVNVVYLNTLQSEEQKHFFVAMVAREVYNWMLKNPSESQDAAPQLLFYIDEVSTYMPAGAREPPAEPILRLLFKQGRKYGVGMIATTQNFGDLDYKSMAQASTWAIGRLTIKQDHEKVKPILKALNVEAEEIPKALGALKPGNFVLIAPDLFPEFKQLACRWLYSDHRTLPDDELRDAMSKIVVKAMEARYEKKAKAEKEEEGEETSLGATPASSEPVLSAPASVLVGPPPVQPPVAATSSAAPPEAQFPILVPGPRPAIVAKLLISRDDAANAARWIVGSMLGKPEAHVVAMRWFPLWQIEVGKKRGLLGGLLSKSASETVYMSGEKELIMHVTDKMRFRDSVPPDPGDIVDVDGKVQWESQGVDPGSCPPPELKQEDARGIARRTFGVEVAAVRLVYLPVWVLDVEGRRIYVDGVLGKEVVF